MKVIHKQILDVVAEQTIAIPVGAVILHIGAQRNTPFIWYETETDAQMTTIKIRCIVTGESFRKENLSYLGTVKLEDGYLVLHYYKEN